MPLTDNTPQILLDSPKPTTRKISEDIDLIELFGLIESKYDKCFILESLGQESTERYTILGFDPESILSGYRDKITQTYKNGRKLDYNCPNPYRYLQNICPQNSFGKYWTGGLVGFLSYEAVNFVEPTLNLQEHTDFELFKFGVYTDGLIYDKTTAELIYFFYNQDRSKTIEGIIKLAKEQKSSQKTNCKVKFLGHNLTPKEHQKKVNTTLEEIKKGNTFQAEVGMKSKYQIQGNCLPIYKKLRQINPSPFSYYLKFEDQTLLGASPELLLRVKDKEMITSPLAGTIQRGKDNQEDMLKARSLLNDHKEVAEHNMLVDMHRNDLGRVAQFGTVKVRELMEIKKFSHVQHISSDVVGILDNQKDMFDALASIFPGGVVSGSPKIETIKIIARNEDEPRGPYAGAVGQFGFNGDCTFCIPIRSLFVKGQNAFAQTSSGIVYDSKAEDEYQELVNKLRAMQLVLQEFE